MKHRSRLDGVFNFSLLMLCALLARNAVVAEADPAAPVLTPKDVLGWMAPLRIENGRLGIDWGTIGLISAQSAGVKTGAAGTVSVIDTDVKFVVSAGREGDINAPEYQVVLHADGGSIQQKDAKANARDLPISVRIVQKGEDGGLRGEFTVQGRTSVNGQSYDASEMRLNLDSPTCLALFTMNRKTRDYRLKFKEEKILKADLSITHSGNILIVHLETTDVGTGFDFTQKPNGEAELTYSVGENKRLVRAAGFHELALRYAGEMQLNFFRPLADMGVQVALCPDLPVVMAAATTGFSNPLPENTKKAEALILAVTDAPTPQDRAKAVTDLTRFFPQAIMQITQAAENARDPNAKAALQKVIAAHPGIARALPYVQSMKLQNDRAFIFDIFEHSLLLKDAARARLIVLEGKDWGDDPEAWKKK